MPFACHMAENFIEWPTLTMVGTFPGTGWSPSSGSAPSVQANTNFASGKCLRWQENHSLPASRTFPATVPPGVQWGFQFNFIRQIDSDSSPTLNGGQGIRFLTGLSDYYLQIVQGQSSVGLQNTWYLQSRAGASGTFQTIATSENKYLLGTKHTQAINADWTTGAFEWWIDDELIFSNTVPALGGSTPTAFEWGRLGTEAASGRTDIGDIILYTDENYNGPLEVRGGLPTANDALQDWSFVGGPSAWESVNNTFVNPPTQYIESGTLGDISDFVCPIDDTNVVSILSVEVGYYAIRTDVALVDMQGRIGEGISFTNGQTENPPQATYERFASYFDIVNPNSGVNWVPADLPNILVGVERTS